jgi:glycosyltransferase involved in cell wall biosynthesis
MALSQFQRQTYQPRELVVVCDQVSAELETLVAGTDGCVRLVPVPTGLSLGELRNASVAAAQGEIVCQWDDDDLYGDYRLEDGVGALLAARAAALFLRQWFVWCPSQRFLGVSRGRIWEGTMIAHRQAISPYPHLRHAEDTAMVDSILPNNSIAILDAPLSCCYCIHGANTFGDDHMQSIIDTSELKFEYEPAINEFSRALSFSTHPTVLTPMRFMKTAGKQASHLKFYLSKNQIAWRLQTMLRPWLQ